MVQVMSLCVLRNKKQEKQGPSLLGVVCLPENEMRKYDPLDNMGDY